MARFMARARAVDMLGRQQIAGIPTAISELFKNAHDAYADRVEVDYYRYSGLLVLRDDGTGMTAEDFQERWLTIGTESKLGATSGLRLPPRDTSKRERPVLGEKGIGRLAIAVIGPQVLVLTRAKRGETLHDLVAAFLHWGVFEIPGVNLEEIEIPVKLFSGGSLPTSDDVAQLVAAFRENLERLQGQLPDELAARLVSDLDNFELDPSIIDTYVPELSLAAEGHGTQFIIHPVDEILNHDIDPPRSDRRASNLTRMLRGFSNTMVPDSPIPPIRAAFREHKTFDHEEDLINSGEFFTPKEFRDADHHISGRFDEFGQFRGTVSVYGEEHKEYAIPWSSGGKETRCGPFHLNLAVVQGMSNQSTIPYEDWSQLTQKMDLYGGLYIYRNGIRVLPYGSNDYDWVEIEKRRTNSAYYYYFSYRRIFGVVEIDGTQNQQLREKAGREGFIQNRAYRQLRDILMNFFVQIAADFFREEGGHGDIYQRHRTELDRLDKVRKAQAKRTSAKRDSLNQALHQFFVDIDGGRPTEESLHLSAYIEERLKLATDLTDRQEAARVILDLEREARKQLSDLEARYKLSKPRGVALNKRLQRDWSSYLSTHEDLGIRVFIPAAEMIDSLVGEAAQTARITLDRRVRVERTLSELSSDAKKETRMESTDTRKTLDRTSQAIAVATRESITKLEDVLREVFAEFNRTNLNELKEPAFVNLRARLESRILETKDQEKDFLRYLRTQLEGINISGESGRLEELEALEERNLALEERADMDLQMVQLGMAIEVINHEFEGTIRAIRSNLGRLKTWADANDELQHLYRDVRANFEHLDGYLTLFTPLHRRLRRQPISFTGMDIYKFLGDLFRERLRRHDVTMEATEPFRCQTITGYPSSFYPIFVNLVDNAIFWTRDRPQPRLITLDAHDESLTLTDSGPGIPLRDMEAVFELGFTRKPGGRGMGLHISRETLQRVGYQLLLLEPEPKRGARFMICPNLTETTRKD